jgi:hypothetical protein
MDAGLQGSELSWHSSLPALVTGGDIISVRVTDVVSICAQREGGCTVPVPVQGRRWLPPGSHVIVTVLQ